MVAAAELDGAQQMLAGLVGVEDDNAQRGTRRRLRRYWLGESLGLFRARSRETAAQPRHVVLRIELSGCAIPPTAHLLFFQPHPRCFCTPQNRSPRARARSAILPHSSATRSPQISPRSLPRSGGGPQRPSLFSLSRSTSIANRVYIGKPVRESETSQTRTGCTKHPPIHYPPPRPNHRPTPAQSARPSWPSHRPPAATPPHMSSSLVPARRPTTKTFPADLKYLPRRPPGLPRPLRRPTSLQSYSTWIPTDTNPILMCHTAESESMSDDTGSSYALLQRAIGKSAAISLAASSAIARTTPFSFPLWTHGTPASV